MPRLVFEPIGVVHSPFTQAEGTPIQPSRADGTTGVVELYPRYAEGLSDPSGFSHIILITYLHRAKPYSLKVVPYLTPCRAAYSPRGRPADPTPSAFPSSNC